MEPEAIARAAERLARARLDGGLVGPLPVDCRPSTEDEGYAIQDALHVRLSEAGLGAVVGRKIGATTSQMQAYLGVDHPCAGGIQAANVFHEHATFRHRDFRRVGVECEIAVRLGRALGPGDAPFDRSKVAGAVEAVLAAIEVVDDRYSDFRSLGTPMLIADDFFHAACVLGDEVQDHAGLDLAAASGRMAVNGEDVASGRGRDVLGHPYEALAWLASLMARRGQGLRAGDIVLLGSLVPPRWLEPGDAARIAIDGLGEIGAAFL